MLRFLKKIMKKKNLSYCFGAWQLMIIFAKSDKNRTIVILNRSKCNYSLMSKLNIFNEFLNKVVRVIGGKFAKTG